MARTGHTASGPRWQIIATRTLSDSNGKGRPTFRSRHRISLTGAGIGGIVAGAGSESWRRIGELANVLRCHQCPGDRGPDGGVQRHP